MFGVPASWGVVNVAIGAESARSNFSEGNVAAGLVDSIGVTIGLTATAVAIHVKDAAEGRPSASPEDLPRTR